MLFMQSQDFFGADSQIHASIMRHLDRDRFEVHCAIPRDERGERCASSQAVRAVPDVHIRPTDFGPSLEQRSVGGLLRRAVPDVLPAVWSLLGLAWYVRRRRIRVVHCTEKPRDAIYGTVVAKLGGARCVIHVHVKAETWIRGSVRRAMGHACALIGVSEFVAGSIRDLGYDPAKVTGVLNGLELDDWHDRDVDTEAIRREFGVAPGAPLIVSASRLYRYKGQHDLLAALPDVVARFPDLKVLIVGADDPRGHPGEERYSDVLRGLCDELDLNRNVVFTGWRSDVRELMTASDVYAMPSFEEPFGMVFTEAMHLRRPVVALNNGGTREVVEHGRSGLLSEPGDVPEIARNLLTLLDDDALRRRMGADGRRRVVELLNSERMADDVERVYERMLAG